MHSPLQMRLICWNRFIRLLVEAHQKPFQVLGLGIGEAANDAVKFSLQDLLSALAARAQEIPPARRKQLQHHFLDVQLREKCLCARAWGGEKVGRRGLVTLGACWKDLFFFRVGRKCREEKCETLSSKESLIALLVQRVDVYL